MRCMDDRTLRLLDYPKILSRLASNCRTSMGAQAALEILPEVDEGTVSRMLEESSEARRLLSSRPVLLPGVTDVRGPVGRAARMGVLSARELFDVAETLRGLRLTRHAVFDHHPPLPRLSDIVWPIPGLRDLEDLLYAAVDEAGVRDDASPRLRALRQRIRREEEAIRSRLESMVRQAEFSKLLQEPIVTQRQGRWVVPVRVESKSQVPGIVHDASQSGATLFVEPEWAVEAEGALVRLREEEKREVDTILADLSRRIGQEADRILLGLEAAVRLDLVLAKGQLADLWDGTSPEVSQNGTLRLPRARHPLLGETAVPITIAMSDAVRIVVVTGPNTGGKTVTLKTVGLLALLFQTGIPIPVGEGAHLPVFQEILADIGDEQSIEQSLSTFSSHMSAIVGLVAKIRPISLVLLDELGAGTDPAEGAALAQAVVERLLESPVLGVVTTHYAELKALALSTSGLENASVEFDEATLSPTYRLLMGTVGKSQAFLIARRLGLGEEIIERARRHLTGQDARMEDLIAELEDRRMRLEANEARSALSAERAEADRRAAEAALISARESASALTRKAQEEARQLLREARRELRETVKQARRAREEAWGQESLQRMQSELETWEERLVREEPRRTGPRGSIPSFRVGESVFVESLGQAGQIVELNEGKREALVEVGMARIWRPEGDLTAAEEEREAQTTSWARLQREKASEMSPELNVLGLRVEEALGLLDKFLDDASLAGLERVRIVHGKGTGRLRTAISEALDRHPQIRSHHLADQVEGGAGATIAEL